MQKRTTVILINATFAILLFLRVLHMKKYAFLLLGAALITMSCTKEPAKGEYIGNFSGIIDDAYRPTEYKSTYEFIITKSTAKEIVLQEKTGNTSSTLKKSANDSISGAIGFARVYGPNTENNSPTVNMLKVQGRYYTMGEKSVIEGVYEGNAYYEGQPCKTTGTFSLKQSK